MYVINILAFKKVNTKHSFKDDLRAKIYYTAYLSFQKHLQYCKEI